MAPLLVNVKNSSGTSVDLYVSGGKHFHIPNGETVTVNHHLDATIDTKIQVHPYDVHGYLLKYECADESSNKIMINGTLGRSTEVAYTAICMYYNEECFDIEILSEIIIITGKYLRVYLQGRLSKYYKTVLASHKEGRGAVAVTGVDEEGEGPSKD